LKATAAPRRANSKAMARPMPRVAPVTMAARPEKGFCSPLKSFSPSVQKQMSDRDATNADGKNRQEPRTHTKEHETESTRLRVFGFVWFRVRSWFLLFLARTLNCNWVLGAYYFHAAPARLTVRGGARTLN
jgi:hypothetical protein